MCCARGWPCCWSARRRYRCTGWKKRRLKNPNFQAMQQEQEEKGQHSKGHTPFGMLPFFIMTFMCFTFGKRDDQEVHVLYMDLNIWKQILINTLKKTTCSLLIVILTWPKKTPENEKGSSVYCKSSTPPSLVHSIIKIYGVQADCHDVRQLQQSIKQWHSLGLK